MNIEPFGWPSNTTNTRYSSQMISVCVEEITTLINL